MNNVELNCGDALDVLKTLDSGSIDLIIADPPYNLGKNYGNNSDNLDRDEYIEFSKQWLTESHRVLKDNGTIYVFMGVRFISYIYEILERQLSMNFNSWVCWHYTQGMGKTKGFSPRHDDILMFSKGERNKFNLDDVRVPQKYYRTRNNMRGANPGDVWEFSHVHYCNENRQNHPTQKPEGLMERMVLASSDPGEVVLDPFAGSGTTARVCQQLGRRSINVEINPLYLDMIRTRLARPFAGFDSIDLRMERVPLDLRDTTLRNVYLENHVEWFLKNHANALEDFRKEVLRMYGPSQKLDQSLASQNDLDFGSLPLRLVTQG